MTAPIVTLSGPYGTFASVIGQAVADQLGVPMLDRAIPSEVARSLAVPESDALAYDERADTRMARVIAALATAGFSWGSLPGQTDVGLLDEDAFRRQAERVIREHAESGGVILGRASSIVLRDHPTALHVYLRGSLEGRVRQAIAFGTGTDTPEEVRRLIEDTDRTRKAYYHHFYRAVPDDPKLYHLTIDATVLAQATSIELIVTAAKARSAAPS